MDKTIAEAVHVENKAQKEAEAYAAQMKAERKKKADEARALDEKRTAEIDGGTVLPDPLPADLAAACDDLIASIDAYMKAGTDEEIQEFSDGRRAELGEHRAKCIKLDSIQVAACGAHALRGSYPSLTDVSRAESSRRILDRCAQKFGPA